MESAVNLSIRIYPKARHHAQETNRNHQDYRCGTGVALDSRFSA